MSKVIITADVHFHDFRSYNLGSEYFRLEQFDKLTDRILQIAEENNAKYLIIAGDFFHKSNPRPYIVNRAFGVLKKLSSKLKTYIIHGQHDLDSRSEADKSDTLLNLVNHLDNVEYVDNEIREIENLKFYFRGWRKDSLFSNITPCDIFVSHGIPSGAKNRFGYEFDGDSVSEYPFKIAFIGDIHKYQVLNNKIIIPGVPIQHSFSDDSDTKIIVFDTEQLNFDAISIESDKFKPLKFLYSDSKDSYDGPSVKNEVEKISKASIGPLNPDEEIENHAKKLGVLDIHQEIFSELGRRDSIDANFRLNKLKLKNVLKIKDFEFSVKEGITTLIGENGSGKTTTLTAILYALTGYGSIKDLSISGKASIEVEFEYSGANYKIQRGVDSYNLYINGNLKPFENQRALKDYMQENFGFLRVFDLLYHDQNRGRFLAGYNYKARIDLVSRTVGLDRIDLARSIAEKLKRATQSRTIQIDADLDRVKKEIQDLSALDYSLLSVDFESEKKKIADALKNVQIEYQEYSNLLAVLSREKELAEISDYDKASLVQEKEALSQSIDSTNIKYQDCYAKLANIKSRIAQIENLIEDLTARMAKAQNFQVCYTCGQPIDIETSTKLIDSLENNVKEKKDELENLKSLELSAQSELKLAESYQISLKKLEEVNSKLQRLYNLVELQKQINNAREALSNLRDPRPIIEFLQTRLGEIEAQRKNQESLKIVKNRYDSATAQQISSEKELIELNQRIEKLGKYLEIINPAGPYVKNIFEKLATMLSREDMGIQVCVQKELKNGELRPDFELFLNSVKYDALSGGQKTLVDIHFITSLINLLGGAGILVLDETLSQADQSNIEKIIAMIESANITSTFIVTHEDSFYKSDHSIRFESGSNPKLIY